MSWGERVDPVLAGKEPALRPGRLPPGAQEREKLRREHDIAILAALALLDADDHAGGVDVADLEGDDLRGAQTRPVGDTQRRLGLEVGRRLEQAGDLVGAEDHRQLARLGHERDLLHDLRPEQGDLEEEAQGCDGMVDGGRAGAGLAQEQLVAAHILEAGLVRRGAEEGAEAADGADVGLLGARGEMADRHVVDQALAKRADGRVDHGRLLS